MLLNLTRHMDGGPADSSATPKHSFCRAMKRGHTIWDHINPLPNDKILDWSKLEQIVTTF